MTRVLLITGARSLADDPAAEAWARGLIAEALVGVDLLIVGDASGPDAWACERAAFRMPFRQYVTKGRNAGWVMTDGALRRRAWTTDEPPHRGDPADMTRAWYLLRNDAMIRSAQDCRSRGHDVSVLALIDGRKATATGRVTRGTEHTAGLARAAGLTVDAQTWAPKGATT